jgi:hypothetical protein
MMKRYLSFGQDGKQLGGKLTLSELERQRLVHSAIVLEGEDFTVPIGH